MGFDKQLFEDEQSGNYWQEENFGDFGEGTDITEEETNGSTGQNDNINDNNYSYTNDLWFNDGIWLNEKAEDIPDDTGKEGAEQGTIDLEEDRENVPEEQELCGSCKQDVDWSSEDYTYPQEPTKGNYEGLEPESTSPQDTEATCGEDFDNDGIEDFNGGCREESDRELAADYGGADMPKWEETSYNYDDEEAACRDCEDRAPDCSPPIYQGENFCEYAQNKNGYYFGGQGKILKFSFDTKAYYVLKNPVGSNVNIFLCTCEHANLSGAPMKVNVYCKGTVSGSAANSPNISTQNSDSGNTRASRANILFGSDLTVCGGIRTQTLSVSPYATVRQDTHGAMILAPGCSYIIEMVGLSKNNCGCCIASFTWWEEPRI